MIEAKENTALISLDEWQAIRNEVQKTVVFLQDPLQAGDEPAAAPPPFPRNPSA